MAPGSGLVTILFTDLVNSTELLAQQAAEHQGEEVKWLGDA